jgi:general secretion pathway protein A
MSYEQFFKLKEHPFSNAPDIRFWYDGGEHSEAMVRIMHAVDTRKGLAVMIGDIGTGKTLLARRLLETLEEDEDSYEASLLVVVHSEVTADWMLKKIAQQLGVEEPAEKKGDVLNQLYERLMQIYAEKKRAVVIIDEANMLRKKEIYEELRGLLNLEVPGNKLVSLVLLGMPELEEYLKLDPPLVQRVDLKFKLQSLTEVSTREYIQHRLSVAGGTRDLFDVEAYKAVYEHSKGIPRVINTICDNALLEGYIAKQEMINKELMLEVIESQGMG